MAGGGACSGRRGREQHRPLRWKAPAFLGEFKIAEFLTHTWAESSLGLWTTVTEWLSAALPPRRGQLGLAVKSFSKTKKGLALPLLNWNSLRGLLQSPGQTCCHLSSALLFPSPVTLAGALHST